MNSTFWFEFSLGAMGGGTLGAIIMTTCAMAKSGDRSIQGADDYEPRQRNFVHADRDRIIAFGERGFEAQQGHPRFRE
ncbi:hypothetical protein [Bradyrhizobium yuanmingense]|uniref:hypothetical protein n=1 Tax=Bradyrhizobium yuanmingense TaxID=108015 RepID=UPI00131579BF|nr:hypothetical protein [Bradyrhizobium yuanmingense]